MVDQANTSKSFWDFQQEIMGFINEGVHVHHMASSQEEWEKMWSELLAKHGMDGDEDMKSLVYTPSNDTEDTPALRVVH